MKKSAKLRLNAETLHRLDSLGEVAGGRTESQAPCGTVSCIKTACTCVTICNVCPG
jgi:hypothetical protein